MNRGIIKRTSLHACLRPSCDSREAFGGLAWIFKKLHKPNRNNQSMHSWEVNPKPNMERFMAGRLKDFPRVSTGNRSKTSA